MNAGPPDPTGAAAPTLSRRARRMREAPRRAGDRNEAALLEAARELLLEGEFQNTPIRQIAKQAGISRQGFYFYYQSKDELLAQLVTETLYGAQSWRESFPDADWSDPAGKIRRIIAASVTNWREHREVLGAASEMAPRAPVILEHWRAVAEESADFLADMVVASTTIDGLRDRDTARRMFVTLVWMLERNCYMHMVHGSDESDAALTERLSDIFIRALGLE
jgi:TetR/AcrR family transcriptional regulator, ethionamide resistance regulator